MEVVILVNSSSQDMPYSITIKSNENNLSIVCDCKADAMGNICKHKNELVEGNKDILYDDEQLNNFTKAIELISNSSFPELIRNFRKEEKDFIKTQRNIKKIKSKIVKLMKEGG